MFTITDISYCAKEDDGLTEGAYCSCTAGYEIYACFFKFSIVSAVPIQDHKIISEGIASNLGWNVPNKFMTKCCSYYGINESVHFNNVWEMSVQISLEANDPSTY